MFSVCSIFIKKGIVRFQLHVFVLLLTLCEKSTLVRKGVDSLHTVAKSGVDWLSGPISTDRY